MFYVKHKTDIQRLGAAKTNTKAINKGAPFCSTIRKWECDTKINSVVKQSLNDCILQYPNVVKSPISNHCVKVSVDDCTETIVHKMLLKFSVI